MRVFHAGLVAATILLASLGGPLAARDEPYSVWDEGPLGLAHLVAPGPGDRLLLHGAPLEIGEGRLGPRAGKAHLIVEPQRGFDDREVGLLRGFLERGGTALLLGGSPALEELLERLGAGVLLGGPLYSPGFHRDAAFPVVEGLGGTWVLTAPRAVHGGEPLLRTGLAWEDLDGDGEPDLDEPVGAVAVAAQAPVGAGLLMVVGSPSPLTRDGWPLGPGPALLDAALAGQRGVVVDEAHRAPLDPMGIGGYLAGEPAGWLLPPLVLALGLVWALRPRVRSRDADPPVPAGARAAAGAAPSSRL